MTDLQQLIKESPALPSVDVSTDEMLHFLNEWYQWREKALEAVARANNNRSERINSVCLTCDKELPESSRQGREYCSPKCRKAAYELRRHTGKVVSVRRVTSGDYSVVARVTDTTLKPGDRITLA